ncbi:MAG TPA: hypothetical protein RMH99_24950 [Sandaracinaceae bacterium LLY-WYZ-13_1]|nr:hypothetical protein [Sandaracinaceae bacterium LLY-WYZ-13_1]
MLHYYDFDTRSFGRTSSRSLLAEEAINSQEVENWLSRYLESPLGTVRPRLVVGDPAALDDWRFYRACVLMLWLQGARSSSVGDEASRRELESLAGLSEQEMDQLTAAFDSDYQLALAFTTINGGSFAPLFFPSTGLFSLMVPAPCSATTFTIALGLPVDLHCALIAVPHPVEAAEPLDLSFLSAQLSNWSIGAQEARRVVLPPELLAGIREDELRDALEDARKLVTEMLRDLNSVDRLLAHASSLAGLAAPEVARQLRHELPRDRGDE